MGIQRAEWLVGAYIVNAVFIDTAPLIYLLEGKAALRTIVSDQLRIWIERDVPIYSSVLTLTELLVPAKRDNKSGLIYQYKTSLGELLSGPLYPIDELQAERAAEIRAEYGIATPDALQLSAALALGCDGFYTNDRRLCKVSDIEMILVTTG